MSLGRTFAVIGAGHGGKAMAAYLAARGCAVVLYNRTPSRVEAIRRRGGIELELEDGSRTFGPLLAVTSEIAEAAGCDVLMVVVPSSAHRDVARALAPHLRDGQVVILHPGRTCGAIEFRKVLRDLEVRADVVVAETQTFIFASRSNGPAEAKIFRIKNAVPLAALPATRTAEALEAIAPAFAEFVPADNVLHTSLDNMGAIFHPALTILNAGWIERTRGDYAFYMDGVTPSVARVLEALDRERVTVAAALGIRAASALEWLATAYDARGSDLHEAMHNNPGYEGIKAPPNLEHRYIFEDIPCSLVPISEMGQAFGVRTGAMDTLIKLASIIHRTDYRSRGRTLDHLGLAGLTVEEIRRYVEEGHFDRVPGRVRA